MISALHVFPIFFQVENSWNSWNWICEIHL